MPVTKVASLRVRPGTEVFVVSVMEMPGRESYSDPSVEVRLFTTQAKADAYARKERREIVHDRGLVGESEVEINVEKLIVG